MRFGLSVPFRTLLNLESEIVGVHRKDAEIALRQAFEPIGDLEIVASLQIFAGNAQSGVVSIDTSSMLGSQKGFQIDRFQSRTHATSKIFDVFRCSTVHDLFVLLIRTH